MENLRRQRIIVLGSGPALSSAARDNTSYLFDSSAGSLFIDCSGSPFHKLQKMGVDPERLRGVILTHAHSDHLYGLPSLLHELWLSGRRETLHIYANAHTGEVARALLDVFKLREKPVPLEFHRTPDEEEVLLLENDLYLIHTSPVRHEIPTNAVKVTSRVNDRVAVFSADTGPCQELITLAKGADLLFQECSTEEEHPFHCTPKQAGEVAGEAGVGEVILVHCHHNLVKEPYVTIAMLEKRYHGPVRFAQDLDIYDL
jgi:ribonuclease Z